MIPPAGDEKGRWVHFRVRDAYHPEPAHILAELHGDDVLQGRVVDASGGAEEFFVVEVDGLRRAVIVRKDQVLGTL